MKKFSGRQQSLIDMLTYCDDTQPLSKYSSNLTVLSAFIQKEAQNTYK